MTRHLPVVSMAAEALGLDAGELLLRCHKQPLVRGRALVVWLLRTLPSRPMSYPEIGKVLGGMDHQSMIHLHRKAIYLRLRDRAFASACKSFLTRFYLSEEDLHVRR